MGKWRNVLDRGTYFFDEFDIFEEIIMRFSIFSSLSEEVIKQSRDSYYIPY